MGDILGMITQIFYDLWVSLSTIKIISKRLPTIKENDQAIFSLFDYLHPCYLLYLPFVVVLFIQIFFSISDSLYIFLSLFILSLSKARKYKISETKNYCYDISPPWRWHQKIYIRKKFRERVRDIEHVEWPLWSLSVETKI